VRVLVISGLFLFVGFVTLTGQAPIPIRARSRPPLATDAGSRPIGRIITITPPLGLPPVPVPDDNPLTAETVDLGRRLFFEKSFSIDGTVSCATCHIPGAGGADPDRFSEGVDGQLGRRNAPTVFNAAYNPTQFWDGRASSLEQQAEGPVQNPVEMAHSLIGVERRLAANPTYVRLFELAFGPGRITFTMVEKSIASYERTLLSGNSAFDRYFYGGDKTAMNESAIRGLAWFTTIPLDQPSCANCHRIFPDSATFAEARFHNTGVAWDPLTGTLKDIGRGAFSSNRLDQGAFRTPTLRNIALTAPYMHDGSMKTLEEVLDFYFKGGVHNPFISGALPGHVDGEPLTVPADQVPQAKRDIIEFMKALTGNIPANASAPGVN
jgi:cytochrome c peroxidase